MPLAHLRQLPTAPAHLAGMLVYRGAATPVIDLCTLITGRPAALRLSTRIMIVSVDGRTLGLLAEHVTDVVPIDESRLEDPGVSLGRAPYLGQVFRDELGLTQLIEPGALLTEGMT